MTLKILQGEMIAAMKAKNKLRKDTVSSLVSAVKKAGIDNQCREDIPEDLVNATILKEQKTMQEMIDTCPADRPETLAEYQAKLEIIKEFAPKIISNPEEIKAFIKVACMAKGVELTKANKGAVMKYIMPLAKGKYDMKVVNQCVSEVLK